MQAFTLAQTAFNVQLASPVVVIRYCYLGSGFHQLSYFIIQSDQVEFLTYVSVL
jgi:hypothetical protein